jgi:MoaA/NifB/PqqE/SkfB family radical SAM enzyme
VGDPCATPDLLGICRYLKSIKPDLVLGVNTNGSLKTEDWFRELGRILQGPLDYVVFSIDGLIDTNHVYRRNTNWNKIMRNARAYISTGASAHWDMLVFDHNKHQVDSAQQLAREMGFTWFRSKTTDRWDSHPATDDLRPSEPYVAKDYTDVEIVCEKNRDRSIFIDYLGEIWPCCHMAEAYLSTAGSDKHEDIRQYSNKELMTKYHAKLITNPFYVCRRSCGVDAGKKSQWKHEIQLS